MAAIPPFLPISVSDDSDTKYMPILNTFRGDIIPATFDGSGNINNHPTPFYILCTGKIFNYFNFASLPGPGSGTRIYEQFGLTQGDPTIFPPTPNGNGNYAPFNQFTLTPFNEALTTQNQVDSSPGLLVPVYCYQDPAANQYLGNNLGPTTPAFFFFRADVFWKGQAYYEFDQFPAKPLNYNNFPTPFGVNISNIYYLASYYNQWWNSPSRIATWSLFASQAQMNQINAANANWSTGGQSAPVSIAFSNPSKGYKAVNILRTSTLYTVNTMNQYNDSHCYWSDTIAFDNSTILTWNILYGNRNQSTFAPGQLSLGYPLNFVYQTGGSVKFKKTQGLYHNYYQNDLKNYEGTVCQSGLPWQADSVCSNSGFDINNIANLYEGQGRDNFDFSTTFNNPGGGQEYTSYSCNCSGTGEYNASCWPEGTTNTSINSTNPALNVLQKYYQLTCNTVHAGLYQFLAYQFIPIDFFNVPPKSFIPPIVSTFFGSPTGTQFYSEQGLQGSIGPVGVTGPSWPPQGTGAQLPIAPTGPIGAGIGTITYPYNGATGASNDWVDSIGPNRMDNIQLTQTISDWVNAPDNYFCPTQIQDQPYCGFQDYYQSLMGYFYDNINEITPNSICEEQFVPSVANMSSEGFYPAGACQNGKICVPNYQWLEDPLKTPGPFICQSPVETDPYPESLNGFDNRNAYDILNFNGGGTFPQSQTVSPITWRNLYNYKFLTPSNAVSAGQITYGKTPYIDATNLALNKNINPLTGKTQSEKGPGTVIIFLIIILIVIVIIVIIVLIFKSSNNKKKDMYNPSNEYFYSRVL